MAPRFQNRATALATTSSEVRFPGFVGSHRVVRCTDRRLRVENGKIAEEVGLDDGVTARQQFGRLKAA